MNNKKLTLRPYQQDAVNSIIGHIREQWQSDEEPKAAVLSAFVSAGKTLIMAEVAGYASQRNAKVLILARQGELIEQNAEECWNFGVQNSIFSASLNCKSIHYPVVCGTEGTVANHLQQEFRDWIPNIILIDECHTVDWRNVLDDGENQYSKIINHFIRINPKVVVVGLTGTPYRNTESIIGHFWDSILEPQINREFLVDNSFIVPTIFGFGHDEVQYNLSEFNPKNELGTGDFSAAELEAMSEKMDLTTTQKIMREVIDLTKNRNVVMITCASEKHCKEAASVLPADSFGIVTQGTSVKLRREILNRAKDGSIKYLLQIGCLTTGLNRPLICTSVILRRIGSLTLLVQLLGRGMRMLKPEHSEAGFKKDDHLCLDYSGTMAAMGDLFNDPLLEAAELERAKREAEIKNCPECSEINSEHARRCIGVNQNKQRCDFFWQFKECPTCQSKNDSTSRECRICGAVLIDPNEKLTGKHYTDDDWKPVDRMTVTPTKNGGVFIQIYMRAICLDGSQEVAKLFFNPWSSTGAKRVWQHQFVNRFCPCGFGRRILSMPNAGAVCKMKAMFDIPEMITHRINEKGYSIVHGLRFKSRQLLGNKRVELEDEDVK